MPADEQAGEDVQHVPLDFGWQDVPHVLRPRFVRIGRQQSRLTDRRYAGLRQGAHLPGLMQAAWRRAYLLFRPTER
jgi:hypothetical protein